ncbi:MAG TPA: EAL domain-containing protein [Azonexus sp.]|nr:EAL domain-containing protein [Azonexus sp.]
MYEELLESIERVAYRLNLVTGRFEYISGAASSLFGLEPETVRDAGMELVGRHMLPGDYEAAMARIAEVAAGNPGQRVSLVVQYRVVGANGRVRHCHDSMTLEVDHDGKALAVFGVAVDVSERVLAEAAMHEREAQFRATMEAAQVGIFVLQEGLFRYVNPFLLKLFGYAEDELVDRRGPLDLIVPEQRTMVREEMQQRAAGEPGKPYELTAVRKDGSQLPVMILGSSTTYEGRPASVGTLLDISAQKDAERRARELADFDPLTGLPNRRLLNDRFTQLLAGAERDGSELALVFLDLDHFKRVNDSLGHSVGDELLCAVAQRLSTVVRKVDTLARLGGDEFIIALPGIRASAAAEVASRLLDVCATPFPVGGHELTITPSLGISLYPVDGKDFDTLLRNADAAMYKAKEAGRNAFRFYSSEMNVATLKHLLMESGLRRGLGAREFVLHYQPLVHVESGGIIGVEALIRWQNPEVGLVPPDQFIHVAEDIGLINPIGDWVLREACRQVRAWQDAGLPPLIVAVNVSPIQFRQPGFVDTVASALAASGLEARFLELELTERTVMQDAEQTLGTLSALNEMGVELAVDDFGTGYSSLAYLKRFPVGKLKIDRSFVRDLEADPDDRAIAATILSMGRGLRLKVLAEGVETKEQYAILRGMGCELVQGYHFSRPLPPEQFVAFLKKYGLAGKG